MKCLSSDSDHRVFESRGGKRLLRLALAALAFGWFPALSAAQEPVIGSPDLEPPSRTEWRPQGCRSVPSQDPFFLGREAYRNLHSDSVSSDEVSIALPPAFEMDFVAEPDTFNPTGPVFDSAGNLYFSPRNPSESASDSMVLISTDPEDGSRRFAIRATTSAPSGAGAPLVLRDPEAEGQERIYLGLYDRAIAVTPEGEIVWDVATGLSSDGPVPVFGLQYVPGADAIAAITQDGFIYVLDRSTGAQLLSEPLQLPGEASPEAPPGAPLPPRVGACVANQFARLGQFQGGAGALGSVLLGRGVEVANAFSVDPNTSRLWVAATAPDAADGHLDGVSELGAIYGLDLMTRGERVELAEGCRRFFQGGTASTPALRQDGTRVYVGDAVGNLIALDASCTEQWRIDVGGQIGGSVAVSSDNNELYLVTGGEVIQVFDRGSMAERGFTADLSVFDIPEELEGAFVQRNLQLVGIGANGIGMQVGLAPVGNPGLVARTALTVLDRNTGLPRGSAEGLDGSVAVISSGPDGAFYIGNSPVRRILGFCFSRIAPELFPDPVAVPIGGITKYVPRERGFLVRDAVCAAADRARNAAQVEPVCPDAARADGHQIRNLIEQARRTAGEAALAGEIEALGLRRELHRLSKVDAGLERTLAGPDWRRSLQRELSRSARRLERSCRQLEPMASPMAERKDMPTAAAP